MQLEQCKRNTVKIVNLNSYKICVFVPSRAHCRGAGDISSDAVSKLKVDSSLIILQSIALKVLETHLKILVVPVRSRISSKWEKKQLNKCDMAVPFSLYM